MRILASEKKKTRNKMQEWVCLDGCAELDEVVWAQRDGEMVQVKIKRDGWFPIGKIISNGRGK